MQIIYPLKFIMTTFQQRATMAHTLVTSSVILASVSKIVRPHKHPDLLIGSYVMITAAVLLRQRNVTHPSWCQGGVGVRACCAWSHLRQSNDDGGLNGICECNASNIQKGGAGKTSTAPPICVCHRQKSLIDNLLSSLSINADFPRLL